MPNKFKMPYQRSLKSMVVEAFVMVVVFSIVGHLSVNFWERYIIQSELTQVKESLHSLKKTLANIAYAYDNLYVELTTAFNIDKNKSVASLPRALPIPLSASAVEQKLRNKVYTLDRRRLHDIQVNAALTTQTSKKERPGILKKYFIDNVATQSLPDTDATTITRSPLKATAVEADLSHENCRHHKHYHINSDMDEICPYNRITDKNLKF